jgi:hypothetical protein
LMFNLVLKNVCFPKTNWSGLSFYRSINFKKGDLVSKSKE